MGANLKQRGFTLIELLVVIAIISLLATIVLVSLNSARQKARDARRVTDLNQIVTALQFYLDEYGQYPGNTDNDCSGWDNGRVGGPDSADSFILPLQTAGFISRTPGDPTATGNCNGYLYHFYSCSGGGTGYPCYGCDRPFFVLGIVDAESSSRPYPGSPGWSCPNRNWQNEFDWVVGGF